VVLVVHNTEGIDDAGEEDEDEERPLTLGETESGNLVLIRMVNRVPLLDTSEAIACGFVQGIASKKRLWNSFGLTVTHLSGALADDSGGAAIKLQKYGIRDSEQVAPFFQRGCHAQFQEELTDAADGSEDEDDASGDERWKRKRAATQQQRHPYLLPAKVRLAQCICVLQIHAKPSTLPLPTLSKVRRFIAGAALNLRANLTGRCCYEGALAA
jgi:hypothetical protein